LPASDQTQATDGRLRLDKWLWFARVVKTREDAQRLIETGHVRLNRVKVVKPGHTVKPGDVLTIALNARVRVLEITALAPRRGDAASARLLYCESGDGWRGLPQPEA
jgi:ribosome-associated heat shock protein Hsp15